MELRNAQSVTLAYDGTNPMLRCLLPQALLQHVNKSYFRQLATENCDDGFENHPALSKPIEHLILDIDQRGYVNGPDRIFIERAGFVEPIRCESRREILDGRLKNIARRLGDDISESKPILDSRLPDGSRVAAVIPPCMCGTA